MMGGGTSCTSLHLTAPHAWGAPHCTSVLKFLWGAPHCTSVLSSWLQVSTFALLVGSFNLLSDQRIFLDKNTCNCVLGQKSLETNLSPQIKDFILQTSHWTSDSLENCPLGQMSQGSYPKKEMAKIVEKVPPRIIWTILNLGKDWFLMNPPLNRN